MNKGIRELPRLLVDRARAFREIRARTLRWGKRRVGLTILFGLVAIAAIGAGGFATVRTLAGAGPQNPGHRSPTPGLSAKLVPTPPASMPAPSPSPRFLARAFVPTSMALFDDRHGLIAGHIEEEAGSLLGCPPGCRGLIGVTRDGGQSWKVSYKGPRAIADVTTFGDRLAWATIADCDGVLRQCTGAGILHSEDGGLTWKVIGNAGVFSPSFVSPLDGWAIRASRDVAPRKLVGSFDGGATWRDTFDPCPRSVVLQSVRFVTPRHGWVLCGGEPGAGQQAKAVLETIDGGAIWRMASAALVAPKLQLVVGGLGGSGYGHGIFFLPDGHGWLWMGREYSYFTADGGRSWKPMGDITAPDVREPVGACFTSDSSGFVLLWDSARGGYSLLHTGDGGVRWEQVFSGPHASGTHGCAVQQAEGGLVGGE